MLQIKIVQGEVLYNFKYLKDGRYPVTPKIQE